MYTFPDGATRTVLLTGDLQLTGVSCLLHRLRNTREKLRADVLKFPHHGAWPSHHPGITQFQGVEKRSLTHLLEAVDPEIVVLSVGTENNHGHVRPEVFAALADLRSRKLRIKRFDCTQITRTCLLPAAHCGTAACGGEVEVRISDSLPDRIEVIPAEPDHLSRIFSLTDRKHAGCSPLLPE